MEVVSSRSPPYGFIFLTFLYLTFVLLVLLILGDNDNALSIVRWSTSFFMAGIALILALHLGILAYSNLGLVGFSVLCLGYVFEGCAYLAFDNTGGLSDGLHSNTFLFYIFNIICYSLWTMSAVVLGWIFRITWSELQFESTGVKLSGVCSTLLKLSLLSVIIACIWSAFFASSESGDDVLDEASSKSEHRDQVALRFYRISQWVWYGFLHLFFFVTAWVLRPLLQAIHYEADIIVWGLSSVWASDGVILFQLASFFFSIFFMMQSLGPRKTNENDMAYILLAFQYCMIMTFFFLHNMVFSLSHIAFDHDNSENDGMESGVIKHEVESDTSECSSSEGEGRRKTDRHRGAEIVLLDKRSKDTNIEQLSIASELEHEALPTAGPSGIQAFLRMASMRKPQLTHIRSSRLRLHHHDSHSSHSLSSSSSSSFDDDSTVESRRRSF
jgi:hypothetical protein